MFGNPLLLADDGYQISRSVRLRSSASAYFNKTNSSSPTDSRKWTWSGWVKRGSLSATQNLLSQANSGSDDSYLQFGSSDKLVLGSYSGAGTDYGILTSGLFRDPSAWYHIVAVLDTANATAADRGILYVNGVRQTVTNSANGVWPQNSTNNKINTASQVVNIGRRPLGDTYFDGYLTEVNFVDGQALTPSSFGETDAITGVWKPKKYTGTYGTNGFYLNFSDPSAATAAAIGKDYSGNGNNWTPNNISVTAGVTYDSMLDVPTLWADGGNGRGNYAVLNPLDRGGGTVADGNLSITNNTANHFYSRHSMQLPTSGKWYWEVTGTWDSNSRNGLGVLASSTVLNNYPWGTAQSFGWYLGSNTSNWYWSNNGSLGFNIVPSSPAVFQICYDADNGTIYAGINNTFYSSAGASSGNPSTLTNPTSSSVPAGLFPATGVYQSGSMVVNHGQRPFAYTPPTGFKALNTLNLPEPTIRRGNQYFNAVTYTGTGAARSVTGAGFQPDLVWIKNRSAAISHGLNDSVRGAGKFLYSNLTDAEGNFPTDFASFDADGFSLGSATGAVTNTNGSSYVAWQWKEGATQGFDIVTYTGNGTAGRTISHSLGVTPAMTIVKDRSNGTNGWPVWHRAYAGTQTLYLESTTALLTRDRVTAVSSTTFTVGSHTEVNNNGNTYVAYLFSEVAGFSRAFSYTGNGSADGPFIFLGFRPRWVMWKRTDAVSDWEIVDAARPDRNAVTGVLYANLSNAEVTSSGECDFTANGFKIRDNSNRLNASGGTYVGMAFAETPFRNSLAR
jgi:hypothetical protein